MEIVTIIDDLSKWVRALVRKLTSRESDKCIAVSFQHTLTKIVRKLWEKDRKLSPTLPKW